MEKQVLFSNLTLDFKISVILLSGAAAEHLLAPRERVNLDDANVLKGKRGRSAAREEGERDRGRRREREEEGGSESERGTSSSAFCLRVGDHHGVFGRRHTGKV